MKVKKFQGPSMPETMKKVKKELGPEAVILNSKVVKSGGFLGLFRKNQTEVIAAIDPSLREPSPPKNEKRVDSVPLTQHSQDDAVLKELKLLRSMIDKQQTHKAPEELTDVYNFLLDQELDKDLALNLLEEVQDYESGPSLEQDQWKDFLIESIHKKIRHLKFGHSDVQKPFVHLVGPTGVGKTTTLAKIAADAVINRKWKVGFITTDTYRIAAIDQLKTYASILDVPLEVAYNMEDYKKAREKFKEFDLVLVDTAGRNFRDSVYVKELNNIIEFNQDSETYLVLSMTSKYSDMKDIYHQFKSVPINQLIFTKADETSSFGNVLNMCIEHDIGIAFLTNGQNVPDDISEANPERLSKKLLEGYHHG